MPAFKITRLIPKGGRDLASDFAKSDTYVDPRHARKKVEMLFAHLNKIMGLTRLRLRGASGANDGFTLTASVQNLDKLAKLLPAPA